MITTRKVGNRYRLIVAGDTATAKRFRTSSDVSPERQLCDMCRFRHSRPNGIPYGQENEIQHFMQISLIIVRRQGSVP